MSRLINCGILSYMGTELDEGQRKGHLDNTSNETIQVAPAKNHWWRYALPVIVLVSIVLLASTYLLLSQEDGEMVGNIDTSFVPQYLDGQDFISNVENIQLTLPSGWSMATNTDWRNNWPEFNDEVFAFEKEGSSCLILYVDTPREDRSERVQVSFSDRVFSTDWQFDGNWYVTKGENSESVVFSQYDRQYLDGEFRSVSVFRRYGKEFILLNTDRTAVSSECNNDMNRMLETVIYHYDLVELDDTTDGVLWVTKEFSIDPSREQSFLLYTSINDMYTYKVAGAPAGLFNQTLFIDDGSFYFVKTNTLDTVDGVRKTESGISVYNPLTNTETEFVNSFIKDSYISDTYLHDDVFYYLLGGKELGYCLDRYSVCTANLYRISKVDSDPKIVAEDVLAGGILGFDEPEESVYLRWGAGDGGCSSENFSRVKNGTEEALGSYSGCSGDEGFDAESAKFDWIRDKFKSVQDATRAGIIVKDGSFFMMETLPSHIENRDNYTTFNFGI
ncbi:MAG: hypothetical protein A3J04_01800 [Candidatus Ryanbacteria bacterium RIFCSPLOWO2_02_FULL_47_14]|uniref:Uncharacterized protein n=1 Tax=Candidatus Ryanbacteria bacterium RIFCSPLOWO2_02_FULL_47_14 TaxID=1802129 RepID=A0A1G2H3K2_9BACT|nr:MAG: hypothetical protein A3J04_01800 [Candidatus Ryanbacteria bacterium RIFCSPLOWO2_02_FULL_47_14]